MLIKVGTLLDLSLSTWYGAVGLKLTSGIVIWRKISEIQIFTMFIVMPMHTLTYTYQEVFLQWSSKQFTHSKIRLMCGNEGYCISLICWKGLKIGLFFCHFWKSPTFNSFTLWRWASIWNLMARFSDAVNSKLIIWTCFPGC